MADNINGNSYTAAVPGVQNNTPPTQGSRSSSQPLDHNHPLYLSPSDVSGVTIINFN